MSGCDHRSCVCISHGTGDCRPPDRDLDRRGSYPNGGDEFNLGNDINAANVVMKSTIPLWQVPRPTYMKMRVSLAELEYRVRPCGEIGRYLFDQLVENSGYPESV